VATLTTAIERAGIPAVVITALPTIAAMAGANRIVRGVAVAHPTGDPERPPADELIFRRRLVERALALLATPVSAPTVWEA
jgi:glycine reductase